MQPGGKGPPRGFPCDRPQCLRFGIGCFKHSNYTTILRIIHSKIDLRRALNWK